jgi:DNA-binding MarR family transcriptional regulator
VNRLFYTRISSFWGTTSMNIGAQQPVPYSKAFEAVHRVRRREHPAHIDTLIRLVSVRIVRLSELILRIGILAFKGRFGVKPTDLRILVMLGAYQPISVNEVSRKTHIDKAWISRSLRDLLRRKLIKRTPHPSDSRAALLSLTSKGEVLLREIAPAAEKYQRQLLQGQRSRDVERMLDLLSARAEEMFQVAMQQKDRAVRRR